MHAYVRATLLLSLLVGCGSQGSGSGTMGNPAASGSGSGQQSGVGSSSGATPTPSGTGANGADATTSPTNGADASTSKGSSNNTGDGGPSSQGAEAGDASATGNGDASSEAGASGDAAACNLVLDASTDPCTAPLKPNDDRLCVINYGGQMRQFYIYAPPSYNPCQPASLIVDCHGLNETAENQAGKTSYTLSGYGTFPNGYGSTWRMAVQNDNAIVVTPQGLSNSWTPSTDVGFINAAADTVEAVANVNPDRVYVTGISMGGQMTVAVGCDNANRWRGMAPVSMLQQSCAQLSKPTPVISFHASGDQLTSYSADQSLMQTIAGFNNCKSGPTPSMSYGGPKSSPDPVCFVNSNSIGAPDAPDPYHIPLQACPSSAPESDCVTYSQCDNGVEVVFCTVAASSQPLGGHVLYNNDTQLDLSAVAWPFFKKFWK
jgi:polyhydroxybutyrate depolymerase